jgi:hypothetical protein
MSSGELADAVRQWVHFDNVTEHLNKQLSNVRSLRSEYETKILELLEHQNLKHASLRVTGATLTCATRNKPNDLTWSFLEEQLHEYFKTSGVPDKTADIIRFLQTHRGGRTVEYLKKTTVNSATATTAQALPPPASQPASQPKK